MRAEARASSPRPKTGADAASGAERRDHAALAEQHATHAAGLLSESFAWGERAFAVEERGDARLLLGRDDEALKDYAEAVAGYLEAGDSAEAERLLAFFAARLEGRADAPILIAHAFKAGEGLQETGSAAWVRAAAAALDRCPRTAAPSVLGVLIRGFMPGASGAWWFHCLVRSLLAVDRGGLDAGHRGLGPILLLTILAYSPHRTFSIQDLLTLAGLCLGRSSRVTTRHRPGRDLDLIVRIGRGGQILLTIRTEAKLPEAMFVALFAASFLDAFGDELAAILFGDGLPDGAALDTVVFAQAAESELFADVAKEAPVATGRITSKDGENVPIVLVARADAMGALTADRTRGGEPELMLARFVEEVLHATLGASVDDEIYTSKIKDLLMAVLR